MNEEVCHEHSGCLTSINNLKCDNIKQWKAIEDMDKRMDNIFSRLNIILGGIIVSIIMLLADVLVRFTTR